MNDVKIRAFEYAVSQFIKWEEAVTGKENTISKLKAMQLIFFITAATSGKDKDNFLLENVFDNFKAQSYGSLEEDIKQFMINNPNGFEFIKINDRNAQIIKGGFNLDIQIKIKIDEAIDELRSMNKNIIKLYAYDLMNINRVYYSWKKTYEESLLKGKFSGKIDNNLIIEESKIFNIDIF